MADSSADEFVPLVSYNGQSAQEVFTAWNADFEQGPQ